ncbi:MAG: hypothetical protein PVI26_05065, partial [Chitinispirillia bacterium]
MFKTVEKAKAMKYIITQLIVLIFLISYVLSAPSLIPYTPDPTNDLTPTLYWNSVSGASQYNIEIDSSASFSSPIVNDITASTDFTPTGDLPSGDIYWHVSSDLNYSDFSTYDHFVITGAPLLIPYSTDPTTDLTPTLYWNSLSGATNYRVQVDDNTSFSTPLEFTTTSGATSYTTTDLWQGNVYWKVSSDIDGYTEYCPYDHFVISTAPTILAYSPDPTPDMTPQLSWNPVSGATGYYVKWDDNIGFTSSVTQYVSGATSYSAPIGDEGLWYWCVSSNLDSAYYSSSDNFSIQKPTLLSFPEDTTADQTPTLEWNSYPGAYNYKIEIDDDIAFSSPVITDIVSMATTYTTGVSLSTSTTYYWHVSTDLDYSSFSYNDTFTVDINSYPMPISFSPQTVTTLQPLFQWNSVSGASNYTLYADSNPSFTSLAINTTIGATSYNSPTDMNQTTYFWKVSSDLNPGKFCPVETVTINTAPSINTYSPDPTPKYNPTLSWNSVSGATGYKIQIDDDPAFPAPLSYSVSAATSYSANLPNENIWYWRVSSDIDSTYFSNYDSFTYQKPQIDRFNGLAVHTNYPNFTWSSYTGSFSYNIEINDDITFTTPIYSGYVSGATSYNSTYLSTSSTYYWRVSTDHDYTAYSDMDSVRISQSPELVTFGGSTTDESSPTFRWHPVSGATSYTFQIDTNINFLTNSQSYPSDTFTTPPNELSPENYYWRVSSSLDFSDYSNPDSLVVIDTMDI